MLASPLPAGSRLRVEAAPSSSTRKVERPVRAREDHADRGRTGVLGGVLHAPPGSRSTPPPRRPPRTGPTPARGRPPPGPDWWPPRPRGRRDQPVRRAAAGRCRATAATRVSIASPRPPPARRGAVGARRGERRRQGLREPQVHGQGDEVLLGAVVDVALERASLGVLGVDQPLARRAAAPRRAARARPAAGSSSARSRAPRSTSPAWSASPANSRSSTEVSGLVPLLDASTPSSSPPCRTGRAPAAAPASSVGPSDGGVQRAAAAARSPPASAGRPRRSHTCAHSAPVPSASTRAIRAGSSSARSRPPRSGELPQHVVRRGRPAVHRSRDPRARATTAPGRRPGPPRPSRRPRAPTSGDDGAPDSAPPPSTTTT